MAFGSTRKTHFDEALKSLRFAESAIKSLEDNAGLRPEPTKDPLPKHCWTVYRRLTTIAEFLAKANVDLARSGAVNKMPAEDRKEYFVIRSVLGELSERYRRVSYDFESSCLINIRSM